MIGLPSRPTLSVANELYQLVLELSRQHPEDMSLLADVDTAWALLVNAWCEQHDVLCQMIPIRNMDGCLVAIMLDNATTERFGYRVSEKRL